MGAGREGPGPDGNVTVYGDGPLTLYPFSIQEKALSIELLKDVPCTESSYQNADELSVQVTCPNGLQELTSGGGTNNYTVTFTVLYRETGTSGDWLTPDGTDDNGASVGNTITLTANTRSAVRGGLRWKLAERGQYDVKVTRTNPGADDIWHQSISFWTALRTIRNEDPLNFSVPLAATALRIKASGRLTGTIERFSGICTSICPDWNPDGIATAQVNAGNPGSGYSVDDVLTVVQEGAEGGTFRVTSIGGGGVVTGIEALTPGRDYSAATGLSTTVGCSTRSIFSSA
jgi:hypothetical protein